MGLQQIRYEVAEGIATITLDRPEQMNTFTNRMVHELIDAFGFGDPSWRDFVWDIIGTSAAITLSVSIDFGVRAAKGK